MKQIVVIDHDSINSLLTYMQMKKKKGGNSPLLSCTIKCSYSRKGGEEVSKHFI